MTPVAEWRCHLFSPRPSHIATKNVLKCKSSNEILYSQQLVIQFCTMHKVYMCLNEEGLDPLHQTVHNCWWLMVHLHMSIIQMKGHLNTSLCYPIARFQQHNLDVELEKHHWSKNVRRVNCCSCSSCPISQDKLVRWEICRNNYSYVGSSGFLTRFLLKYRPLNRGEDAISAMIDRI